jgi:hypothetical protein
MSEVFPVGFDRISGFATYDFVFDVARFRDGEHCVSLVQAMVHATNTKVGNLDRVLTILGPGPKWELLDIQQQLTDMLPPTQINIQNADVLAPDDLWAFIFFLAGFIRHDSTLPQVWSALSPKDEVIAALKASTQAKRSPRLLAIMLHKLGVEPEPVDRALWYERTKDLPWAKEAYDGTLPQIRAELKEIEALLDREPPGCDEASMRLSVLEGQSQGTWGGTAEQCVRLRALLNFVRE